jgi:hypothetical protein
LENFELPHRAVSEIETKFIKEVLGGTENDVSQQMRDAFRIKDQPVHAVSFKSPEASGICKHPEIWRGDLLTTRYKMDAHLGKYVENEELMKGSLPKAAGGKIRNYGSTFLSNEMRM